MWYSIVKSFDRLGLQRRIMLYVSISLALFSSVFAFVALQAIQQSTDLVFRERLLVARTVAHEIDDDLQHLEQEVHDASAAVAPALARHKLSATDETLRALCAHWSNADSASGPCSVWIADAGATVLRSFPPDSNLRPGDMSQLPGFAEAAATGHLTISNGQLPDGSARPAVFLVDPLPDAAGNAGYLVVEIDRADLRSRMDASLQVLQGRYAVEVIDDHGLVVTTNQPGARVASQHYAIVAPLWQAGEAGIRNHLMNENGVETSHTVAFAPLSRIRWGIVVEEEEDEALALPRQLQAQVIALAVLALGAGLALAWATTRAVVRPVKNLIRATQEIGEGKLDHPVTASGRDEVGTLARRFEQMRVALRSSLDEIAAWNQDLESRVQARTRELAALVASSQALAQTLDLDALFEILTRETHTVLPSAEAAILYLWQPESNTLAVRAAVGLTAGLAVPPLSRDEALAGQVLASRAPVRLQTHTRVDEVFATCSDEHRAWFHRAFGEQRVQSALGVPILSKGACLGVLTLYNYSQEAAFTDDAVAVVQALANQAAAAIENARLYREAGDAGSLRELDRLKSEFVARASHELRTPMTAIKSLTESLLREDLQLDPETQQEFLEGIDSAADRLDAIVQQLLTLSRMEAGQLGTRSEPVAAAAVARKVVEEARAQVPTREIVLNVDGAAPRVQGDEERLEDVLRNLVSNALKYSAPGSPVRVDVARLDGHIVIAVADQGIGIPPEERGRIFERFYRVDNAVTRRVGGAGLGLYLCKTYVEAMGGNVAVEDDGGRGSVFKVTLAAAHAPEEASCDLH